MKRLTLAILLALAAGTSFAQTNWSSGDTAWTPYDRDSAAASPGE